MAFASTYDCKLYDVGFTRVTDLLSEPFNTQLAALMFIEELADDYGEILEGSVTVISSLPVFPGDELRDEIEYQFVVLMSPDDVARLEQEEAPYSINERKTL